MLLTPPVIRCSYHKDFCYWMWQNPCLCFLLSLWPEYFIEWIWALCEVQSICSFWYPFWFWNHWLF